MISGISLYIFREEGQLPHREIPIMCKCDKVIVIKFHILTFLTNMTYANCANPHKTAVWLESKMFALPPHNSWKQMHKTQNLDTIHGIVSYLQIRHFFQQKSTDGIFFSAKKYWYFSYFSTKTYTVGTYQKCLCEALLISTHSICFHVEIRKILCGCPS